MKVKLSIKDKGKLIKNILKRDEKFRREVRTEFVLAGEQFNRKMVAKWYSGRNANGMGLNRITGFLSRSWVANVKNLGLNIVAVMQNGAKYGLFQELGVPKRNLPKRTDVGKDIEGKPGKQLFTDAARRALRRSF